MQTVWLRPEILKVIGWTIIHSIWQSVILFVFLKCFLSIVDKKKANIRYIASICALATMMLLTLSSLWYEYNFYFGDHVVAESNLKTLAHVQPVPVSAPISTGGSIEANERFFFLPFLDRIAPYMTFCWIVGLLFTSSKIVVGCLRINALKRLPGTFHPSVEKKFMELLPTLSITRNIKLIISKEISEPLTFGYLKPVILIPLNYVLQVPVDQIEMVLAHELSHVKRNDYIVNFLQSIAEALYFFNPFFQMMSEIARNEREYCCDQMAARCGDEHTLAIALTNLKLLTHHPTFALSAAPVKTAFTQRIHRLIHPEINSKLSIKNTFSLFFVLAVLVVTMTKCVHEYGAYHILPTVEEHITQLLEDHQADHQIDVLNYKKGSVDHEIFLVSTDDAKPLYAYLDGSLISAEQLSQIETVLQKRKTISSAVLANLPPSPGAFRMERSHELSLKIDSTHQLTEAIKKSPDYNDNKNLKLKVDSLTLEYSTATGEVVRLAMEGYTEQIKKLPIDVQMHELLTKIIVSKEYTMDDRKKLNALLQRRGL